MRLVDADELKKTFHDEWDEVLVWDESGEVTANEFCRITDNAPTVDAVPVKHGYWIRDERFWYCSVCNEYSSWTYKYCPHCGASMNKVGE